MAETLTIQEFKAIREHLQMTQAQFATHLGYKAWQTVNSKEKGKRSITPGDWEKLQEHIDVVRKLDVDNIHNKSTTMSDQNKNREAASGTAINDGPKSSSPSLKEEGERQSAQLDAQENTEENQEDQKSGKEKE